MDIDTYEIWEKYHVSKTDTLNWNRHRKKIKFLPILFIKREKERNLKIMKWCRIWLIKKCWKKNNAKIQYVIQNIECVMLKNHPTNCDYYFLFLVFYFESIFYSWWLTIVLHRFKTFNQMIGNILVQYCIRFFRVFNIVEVRSNQITRVVYIFGYQIYSEFHIL